jgi:hypothetical protein
MHRSGTSMLSRILHTSGIFMGNDVDNNHESRFFQKINIELLNQIGSDWITPTATIKEAPLSDWGVIRRFVKPHRDPSRLFKLVSGSSWGWKDPRNTFTLASWLHVFARAKVIHIYRNGVDVALSLYHRNIKLRGSVWHQEALETKITGIDLWEKYTAQAFSYQPTLGAQMLTLQFEKLIGQDQEEIKKLNSFTGLSLESQLALIADNTRTARYKDGEHTDLISRAKQNTWMKKLNYF